MTPEELVEDAESIGRLEPVGRARSRVKQSLAYTLTFPAQEHKLGQGQDVSTRRRATAPGEILELDRDARRLVLKRGPLARRTCRCPRR